MAREISVPVIVLALTLEEEEVCDAGISIKSNRNQSKLLGIPPPV
jgi:hypothetical protein